MPAPSIAILTASPTRLSLNGQNFVFRHGVLPASCWEFPKFVGLTERSRGLKLLSLASRLFPPLARASAAGPRAFTKTQGYRLQFQCG